MEFNGSITFEGRNGLRWIKKDEETGLIEMVLDTDSEMILDFEPELLRSIVETAQKFFAGGEPTGVGVGDIIGYQVGKGAVHETFELARDIAVIDRGRQHHCVRLGYRRQHRCQIVFQYASVQFLLAGIAPLAAAVVETVKLE